MNLGINKLLISHQTNRKQCHYFALQKSSVLFSNTNICYNLDPAENKEFFLYSVSKNHVIVKTLVTLTTR